MAILAKKIQPSKAQAIEEAKKVLSEYKILSLLNTEDLLLSRFQSSAILCVKRIHSSRLSRITLRV